MNQPGTSLYRTAVQYSNIRDTTPCHTIPYMRPWWQVKKGGKEEREKKKKLFGFQYALFPLPSYTENLIQEQIINVDTFLEYEGTIFTNKNRFNLLMFSIKMLYAIVNNYCCTRLNS